MQAELGQALGQPGDGRGVGAAVVVEDHDHPAAAVPEVVEPLEGHAAGHGPVADDGDDPALGGAAAGHRGGQAVGVAQDRRGVAVLHPVVDRLGPRRVARQAAGLAQGAEHLPPAGDDLVHVGLVAGVPQQDVPGRGEHPVQGQRQLDRTQVGAQVAARCRHRLDDEAADLLGQDVQLVAGRACRGRPGS